MYLSYILYEFLLPEMWRFYRNNLKMCPKMKWIKKNPNPLYTHLSLWVLDYWSKAHTILEQKSFWRPAIAWLKWKKNHEIINTLRQLPWDHQTPNKELNNAFNISDLALFCLE